MTTNFTSRTVMTRTAASVLETTEHWKCMKMEENGNCYDFFMKFRDISLFWLGNFTPNCNAVLQQAQFKMAIYRLTDKIIKEKETDSFITRVFFNFLT